VITTLIVLLSVILAEAESGGVVRCSAWLGHLSGAFGKLVHTKQQFIFCLHVCGVSCLLAISVWATPLVETHSFVSAECLVESRDKSIRDVVPHVECLFFQFTHLSGCLVKNKLIHAFGDEFSAQNNQIAAESGAFRAGFPSDGEVVTSQPSDSRPSRRPQGDLDWGYLHWTLSAIVLFLIGMAAGYWLSNENKISDGYRERASIEVEVS